MIQKVFIVGATGGIGKEVVRQIIGEGDNNASKHQNPTMIVGVASRSNGILYNPDGLSDDVVTTYSKRQITGKELNSVTDLIKMVRQQTVFLDLTADREEMPEFHKKVIFETDHSIVTANKFPLTLCTFDEFRGLTSDYERYGFSCSVNAGAGTVNWLRNCVDLNDTVIRIDGCLSGTLGFVATELENGRMFSNVIAEAKQKGYTEPNPIEDLRGGDVERKGMILARAAGIDVKSKNIERSPFVSEKFLESGSLELFLQDGIRERELQDMDNALKRSVSEGAKAGKVERYIANVVNGMGSESWLVIYPRFVDKTSPLGSLVGTANKVIVTTNIYRNGWELKADGAGVGITARNVRADMMDRLRGRKTKV